MFITIRIYHKSFLALRTDTLTMMSLQKRKKKHLLVYQHASFEHTFHFIINFLLFYFNISIYIFFFVLIEKCLYYKTQTLIKINVRPIQNVHYVLIYTCMSSLQYYTTIKVIFCMVQADIVNTEGHFT